MAKPWSGSRFTAVNPLRVGSAAEAIARVQAGEAVDFPEGALSAEALTELCAAVRAQTQALVLTHLSLRRVLPTTQVRQQWSESHRTEGEYFHPHPI